MSRPRWARVTAVVAATLAGGALVAFLVVPRQASERGPGGGRAGSSAVSAPSTAPRRTTAGDSGDVGGRRSGSPVATRHAGHARDPEGRRAAPTRVAVPRLGIDMTVEPQGVLADGQMALPASPEVAGWYRFGSAPDDPEGATVLAAHVDSKTGIGPFVRLGSAKAGDTVEVWTGGQQHAYRVTEVYRVDKTQVDGDGLFAVTGSPRLHLVTCTGAYVPGSGYTDNLVVIAERW